MKMGKTYKVGDRFEDTITNETLRIVSSRQGIILLQENSNWLDYRGFTEVKNINAIPETTVLEMLAHFDIDKIIFVKDSKK